jgi:hypothetical protein
VRQSLILRHSAAGGTSSSNLNSAADQRIVDELHCYQRHNMQLWVTWFTFFVTLNFGALGWFASEIFKSPMADKHPDPRPLYCVGVVFVIQSILGILVSLIWKKQFEKTGCAISTAYLALRFDCSPPEFSGTAYGHAVVLGIVALTSVIAAWCMLAWLNG